MTPIWRKAPGLLLRSPGLFAALAVGALLIVVTIVSFPLFISSTSDHLVETSLADPTVTPYGAGITYTATNVRFGASSPDGHGRLWVRREQLFADAVASSPVLGRPIEQIRGDPVSVTGVGGRIPASGPVQGALFAGDGAVDHVDVLEGTDGSGVWLPDFVADPLHAHVGDTVELRLGTHVVPVTVDGVYRALYTQPQTGYWRVWTADIYPCALCGPPPQPILVDRRQLMHLSAELGDPKGAFALEAPVSAPTTLTLGEARDLRSFATRLLSRMSFSNRSHAFGRVFSCCGIHYPNGSIAFGAHVTDIEFLTAIREVVEEADRRIAGIQGPLLVVVIAGIVISLGVVAAAGVFSFSSRRVEAGVLAARGWGPLRVGAKSMVEAALSCVVGGGLGFALASLAIDAFGPDGRIAPSARSAAVEGAILGVLGSIALIGLVSALAFISRHEPREGTVRALLYIPWEVLALGLAFELDRRIGSGGAVVSTGEVGRPSAAVFLFPLALSFGIAVLAARVATVLLARARRPTASGVSAWYLARRRLTASSRLAALLLVAVSLALSVYAASRTTIGSLRTTVEAKAQVFVGSDVQIQVGSDTTIPDQFPFPATIATRERQAGYLPDGQSQFDLLAVDPATFASAAYWNPGFADRSLPDLLGVLRGRSDGRLPVLVSNGASISATTLSMQQHTIPIAIVGHTSSFPGTSSDRPVFVVADGPLARAFAGKPNPLNEAEATRELWIRGPDGPAIAAATRAGITSLLTITADQVEDIPFIQAAIDTYVVLNVVGVVALLLVLIVAVVYLQARQRSRVVASALSTRMGLRRGTMGRSLTIELGLLLFAGLLIGGASGVAATLAMIPRLDPLPTIPPAPISTFPVVALAGVAIVLGLAAFAGAWLAERGTRGVHLGEVLRVAE